MRKDRSGLVHRRVTHQLLQSLTSPWTCSAAGSAPPRVCHTHGQLLQNDAEGPPPRIPVRNIPCVDLIGQLLPYVYEKKSIFSRVPRSYHVPRRRKPITRVYLQALYIHHHHHQPDIIIYHPLYRTISNQPSATSPYILHVCCTSGKAPFPGTTRSVPGNGVVFLIYRSPYVFDHQP